MADQAKGRSGGIVTALYRGELVRVVRVDGRHTIIVWHGKLRRVQARDLEVTDATND